MKIAQVFPTMTLIGEVTVDIVAARQPRLPSKYTYASDLDDPMNAIRLADKLRAAGEFDPDDGNWLAFGGGD